MRRSRHGACAGVAMVMTVFAVLCLTILAVLSLTTADQEWELAKKTAASVTAYYAADTRAAEIYDKLCAGGVPDEGTTFSSDGGGIAYRVPIDDRQNLEVRLVRDGESWRVAAWQAVDTGDWQPDGNLNVWAGPDE